MDREKVISWLEGLAEDDWRECYSDSEVQETARQALNLIDELLKEQEAVEPKTGHWNGSECSNCHAIFVRSVFDKPEYCSHCGAKMERTGEVE